MSQTILIKRGLKANLPALAAGEIGLCTDTGEVFAGNGAGNISVGRVMQGTYAQRPNAGYSGRLYYVNSGTNLGYIYIDDGASWQRVNALSLSDLTGTIDNISGGEVYGKVKNTELTNGTVNRINDGTNIATAAQVTAHMNDAERHRQINDAGTGATDLWSAQQINNAIQLAKHNIEPQASVKEQDLLIPPSSPAAGDRYIIAAGTATGIWAGRNTQIAEWDGSAWQFYAPSVGWTCYVDNEQKLYAWNGTAWVREGGALQTITAGNGLTGGGQSDTVALNIGQGNGITVGADTISVTADKGITVSTAGVAANIDGTSIIYDSSNGNRLKVATVDGGTF